MDKKEMTIKVITDDKIVFSNGTEMIWEHEECCCEEVYPDFKSVKDLPGIEYHNFPADIQIEVVKDFGFRFGGENQWYFVPCYSKQNGYYGTDLYIIITYPDKTTKKIDVETGVQEFHEY